MANTRDAKTAYFKSSEACLSLPLALQVPLSVLIWNAKLTSLHVLMYNLVKQNRVRRVPLLHIITYHYTLIRARRFQLDFIAEGDVGTLNVDGFFLAIYFDGHAEKMLQLSARSQKSDVSLTQHRSANLKNGILFSTHYYGLLPNQPRSSTYFCTLLLPWGVAASTLCAAAIAWRQAVLRTGRQLPSLLVHASWRLSSKTYFESDLRWTALLSKAGHRLMETTKCFPIVVRSSSLPIY